MKVLVTGANGLVGRAVVPALLARGLSVRAACRRPAEAPPGAEPAAAPDLGPDADWRPLLAGCDAVIHLAARVHVMAETATDPLAAFRHANSQGTEALARQAAAAGVGRLVLVSTVKVLGEATLPGQPFTGDSPPAPADPYGRSKAEAESALWRVCAESGLGGVVVRPPLVHGPGVKGNFAALVRAVRGGWPLPLGRVDNRRSLVGVANLADALATCALHPAAAGQSFLIRDDDDLSTPELIRRLARLVGRPARLLPVPPAWLRLAGSVLGKGAAVDRLLGSLQVEDGLLRRRLAWTPPRTVDEGLAAAVAPAATVP